MRNLLALPSFLLKHLCPTWQWSRNALIPSQYSSFLPLGLYFAPFFCLQIMKQKQLSGDKQSLKRRQRVEHPRDRSLTKWKMPLHYTKKIILRPLSIWLTSGMNASFSLMRLKMDLGLETKTMMHRSLITTRLITWIRELWKDLAPPS